MTFLYKFSDAQHHIMQKKHAWDKLITLSGNVEEDCRKVVALLEEHGIQNKLYFKEVSKFPINPQIENGILVYNHAKEIHGHTVEAFFEIYTKTGEMFLQDAWIRTK